MCVRACVCVCQYTLLNTISIKTMKRILDECYISFAVIKKIKSMSALATV